MRAEIGRILTNRSIWLIALIGIALTAGLAATFWISRDVTSQDQAHQISDTVLPGCLVMYSLVCMIIGGLAVTRDYRWSWMGRMSRPVPGKTGVLAAKSAAVAVFSCVSGIVSILLCLIIVLAGAPDGYRLETTESLWKIAAGALLCCPLTGVMGVGIGFMLRNWLVVILVIIAVLFGTAPLDETTAGQYLSWDSIAASLTLDPSISLKLPFWGALLDSIGLCVVLCAGAWLVMTLRESTT